LGHTIIRVCREVALDADAPKIWVGKERATKKPLFLFADEAAGTAAYPGEIEWKAQPVMRYHGRVPDLARDVINRHDETQATTLFVMPSPRVDERISEILREYNVEAHLTSTIDNVAYPGTAQAIVTAGKLSGGFELPSAHLVVHVEGDLFDEAAEPAIERRSAGIKREKKR